MANSGTEAASVAKRRTPRSRREVSRFPATIPSSIDSGTIRAKQMPARIAVFFRRSPRSSLTGILKRSESPRSPDASFPRDSTYRVRSGRLRPSRSVRRSTCSCVANWPRSLRATSPGEYSLSAKTRNDTTSIVRTRKTRCLATNRARLIGGSEAGQPRGARRARHGRADGRAAATRPLRGADHPGVGDCVTEFQLRSRAARRWRARHAGLYAVPAQASRQRRPGPLPPRPVPRAMAARALASREGRLL